MIVVEGPDGGGKSTLIKALVAVSGLKVAPRVVSAQANAMTDLRVWTEENIAAGFQSMIFDRHRLISDPIYRSILPHKQPDYALYDDFWLMNMVKGFYEARPIIVYCLPGLATAKYNVMNGEDDNSVVEPYLEKIYHAYVARAAVDCAAHQALVYNYTVPGQQSQVISRVRMGLRLRREGKV